MVFTTVSAACGSACFGEGDGEVHYRDVDCSTAHLFNNCSHQMVGGNGTCGNHFRDAGVICGESINKSVAIIHVIHYRSQHFQAPSGKQ